MKRVVTTHTELVNGKLTGLQLEEEIRVGAFRVLSTSDTLQKSWWVQDAQLFCVELKPAQ